MKTSATSKSFRRWGMTRYRVAARSALPSLGDRSRTAGVFWCRPSVRASARRAGGEGGEGVVVLVSAERACERTQVGGDGGGPDPQEVVEQAAGEPAGVVDVSEIGRASCR